LFDVASKRMLALGQTSLIVFASILAFIPQYYIVVFVLYLAVMFGLSILVQRRGRTGSKDVILSGKEFFREEKAMEIALQDKELMEELTAQTKFMGLTFVSLIIALGVFWSFGMFRDEILNFFAGYGIEGRMQCQKMEVMYAKFDVHL